MATPGVIIGLYSRAPQSGKSTVAGILDREFGVSTRSFAAPLKRMVVDLMTTAGIGPEEVGRLMHEGKEEPIPELGGASFRYLAQTLGTDWGRKLIHNDLWVNAALSARLPRFTVIDDVRFPNEAAAIRAKGGVLWLVENPRVSLMTSHASEGQLDGYDFDDVITNDGDLSKLRLAVVEAFHSAQGR